MEPKTVKKAWLILSVIDLVLHFLVPTFYFGIFDLGDGENALLVDSVLNFLFQAIAFTILLNSAYRKPGTRFLSYSIFCGCASVFFNLYVMIQWQSFPLLKLLSTLCLAVWCYISWKLRILNKDQQLKGILLNPEYKQTFKDLQSATTFEILHERYGYGVKKHPEIAWHLQQQYKKRLAQVKPE